MRAARIVERTGVSVGVGGPVGCCRPVESKYIGVRLPIGNVGNGS